jgi:hypothetical protein
MKVLLLGGPAKGKIIPMENGTRRIQMPAVIDGEVGYWHYEFVPYHIFKFILFGEELWAATSGAMEELDGRGWEILASDLARELRAASVG